MAEVRASSGVPTAADFAGLGAPTLCAPLVVNAATGDIYSLTSAGAVVKTGLSNGLSVTITTAKLTGGGANGSMTFTRGILTAQTPAT